MLDGVLRLIVYTIFHPLTEGLSNSYVGVEINVITSLIGAPFFMKFWKAVQPRRERII